MSRMALASTPGCSYSQRRRACATTAKAAMPLGLGGAAGCPEIAARRTDASTCSPGRPSLDRSGGPREAIATCLLRFSLATSASHSCKNLPTKAAEQPASGAHANWASLTSIPENPEAFFAPTPARVAQKSSTSTPGGWALAACLTSPSKVHAWRSGSPVLCSGAPSPAAPAGGAPAAPGLGELDAAFALRA